MERRQLLKTAGILATGGITSLAGCSSSGNGDEGGGEPTTTETQETGGSGGSKVGSNTVMMVTEGSEYYFDPIGLFVESGDTVTFEIKSGSHSATAYKKGNGPASVTRIPEGADAFNSEILSEQGATYEHTFETTGTYDYFCIPHKTLGMVGRIVVGDPGGPAEGSMPPDGDVPESQTIVDQGSVSYSEFSG
ncbi:plastocyanin/azurin family copper-binding protein [Halomarina pelagica]|uniref:plastocyanin/azurin family copper-binding protein n=1 Tax=Halomarina pelagica TaxID=2961599 RepID=UPI0020C5188C|nr:plastocyanin/azurin family copper-binding protein [Halomarina sp. BND7]